MCGNGSVLIEPGWGLLALLVVLPPFIWSRRNRLHERRIWLELTAIVYLDLLLSLTLLPFPLPPYITQPGCVFVYIIPFATIGPALHTALQSPEWRFLAGNVLAFVPVGVLVPLFRPRDRRPWLTVLVAGLLLSLSIELEQLAISLAIGFNYRQADIDDVIVNTLGAATGYALLRAARAIGADRPAASPPLADAEREPPA